MVRMDLMGWASRRVPMIGWLPLYTPSDAISDAVAGLTVGLTLIPQAIAYAALAGLGPQYGLYSAFAGSLIYIVFGTCREVNIGPTALISLLTYTYARGVPEYAILLCFLSGCVTLILGLLRLGFLVELVSTPVVSGFTSAASLIIACSQIKGLLGVKTRGEGFIEIWKGLCENVHSTRMPDLALSCSCIIVLLTLRELKDIKVSSSAMTKFLWLLGTGRNALVVVLCAVAAYVFEMHSEVPFVLTGHVEAGLPHVGSPPFSLVSGNRTVGFLEMCNTLGSGIIVVPLVSIIGNVAIAKAFSHGKTLDATQEMVTLGICNVAGSFFNSMPVTGSFSRSAVNNASGVRSPMGGLYTGVLVILALSLLTPYFYYIPKATLSSVIICAVIFMVEVGTIRPIWRCSKRDLVPGLVTFLACLFAGVELGILIGVANDIAILVYFNARPAMDVEHRTQPEPAYVMIRPGGDLLFPMIDHLRDHLTKYVSKKRNSLTDKKLSYVVLDCRHVHRIDFTAVQGINAAMSDLKGQGCYLILLHPRQEVLQSVQSLAKDPILTAHSDIELITILKLLQDGGVEANLGQETSLEISNLSNPKIRVISCENISTDL